MEKPRKKKERKEKKKKKKHTSSKQIDLKEEGRYSVKASKCNDYLFNFSYRLSQSSWGRRKKLQMREKVKLHFSLVTEGSKFLPRVCAGRNHWMRKCGPIYALPFSVQLKTLKYA